MKLKYTILALIAVLLFSMHTQYAWAEPEDGNNIGIYNSFKDAAEQRRDELLYLLNEDVSVEIMANLQEALQLMQEAENTQNTQESISLYMKALQYFRITWSNYLNENTDTNINTLEEIPEAQMPETEPTEELAEEIKENKVKLLERFQTRIEEEYSSFYGEIEDMMEILPEEDSEKVQDAFEKAQNKLERIKSKIQNGDLDEAIESLDNDLDGFEDDLEYLSDKNASKTIKKIEQMDREAHKTKIEKESKAKKGEDTAEEEKEIKEIKEDIDDAKEEYKGNNGKNDDKSEKTNNSSNKSNKSNSKDKTK